MSSFTCFELEFGSIVAHITDCTRRGIITGRMDVDGHHEYRVQWGPTVLAWHQSEELEVVIPPRPLTRSGSS